MDHKPSSLHRSSSSRSSQHLAIADLGQTTSTTFPHRTRFCEEVIAKILQGRQNVDRTLHNWERTRQQQVDIGTSKVDVPTIEPVPDDPEQLPSPDTDDALPSPLAYDTDDIRWSARVDSAQPISTVPGQEERLQELEIAGDWLARTVYEFLEEIQRLAVTTAWASAEPANEQNLSTEQLDNTELSTNHFQRRSWTTISDEYYDAAGNIKLIGEELVDLDLDQLDDAVERGLQVDRGEEPDISEEEFIAQYQERRKMIERRMDAAVDRADELRRLCIDAGEMVPSVSATIGQSAAAYSNASDGKTVTPDENAPDSPRSKSSDAQGVLLSWLGASWQQDLSKTNNYTWI